jgi:hypothetical protein
MAEINTYSPYTAQATTWTTLNLSQFSASEIGKLVATGGLVPESLPHKLQAFLKLYPWTKANGVFGMTAMAMKRSGSPIVTGDFESVWRKGATLVSTPTTITIPTETAAVDVVANSIVPLSPGLASQPGSDFLVSVSVMAAKTDAGKVVQQMGVVPFVSTFGDARIAPSVPFSAVKLPSLFSTVEGYITHSKEWIALSDSAKLNLTGTRWVAFVATVIAGLPPSAYLMFSTWVATNFLRTVTPKGIVSFAGKPVVPKDAYRVIRQKDVGALPVKWRDGAISTLQTLKAGGHPEEILIVTSPIQTPQAFVGAADATFSSAYSSMQSGDALRGGKNSGSDILSGMLGFTGLITPVSKKIYLTASMALGVVEKLPNSDVDVMVQSIGDIPILYSTILAAEGMSNVRFLVPQKDDAKINSAYLPFIVYERRTGSHLVIVHDRILQVAPTKLEIEAQAINVLDNVGTDFTLYCPIAGSAFFEEGMFVHQFGHCSNFCGIVTTIREFSLLGYDETGFISVPLKVHETAVSWYAAVITSNRQRNVAFLAPTPKYSPITNVISPPVYDGGCLDFEMESVTSSEFQLDFVDHDADDSGSEDEFIPRDDPPLISPKSDFLPAQSSVPSSSLASLSSLSSSTASTSADPMPSLVPSQPSSSTSVPPVRRQKKAVPPITPTPPVEFPPDSTPLSFEPEVVPLGFQ